MASEQSTRITVGRDNSSRSPVIHESYLWSIEQWWCITFCRCIWPVEVTGDEYFQPSRRARREWMYPIFMSTASLSWVQLDLPSLYTTQPEDKCPRAKNDVESQLPSVNTLEKSYTYLNNLPFLEAKWFCLERAIMPDKPTCGYSTTYTGSPFSSDVINSGSIRQVIDIKCS